MKREGKEEVREGEKGIGVGKGDGNRNLMHSSFVNLRALYRLPV